MIDVAQQSLVTIQTKQADLLKYCENIQITNLNDQKRIEILTTEVSQAYNKVEAELNYLLAPILESEKRTRNIFKPYLDKLQAIKDSLRKTLGDWHKAQREVTEAQITQRAEDFWQKQTAAKETGEVVPLPDLAVAPPSKTSHHNMGTTSYRPKVVVKIIKPTDVPREYCMPVESLLRKAGEMALAQGKPMPIIDGVVIEVEYIPIIRSSR